MGLAGTWPSTATCSLLTVCLKWLVTSKNYISLFLPRAVSAVIKWGSLILGEYTSVPFTPNYALATMAVAVPPLFYASRFLGMGKKE